jgi:hypothetical protein
VALPMPESEPVTMARVAAKEAMRAC